EASRVKMELPSAEVSSPDMNPRTVFARALTNHPHRSRDASPRAFSCCLAPPRKRSRTGRDSYLDRRSPVSPRAALSFWPHSRFVEGTMRAGRRSCSRGLISCEERQRGLADIPSRPTNRDVQRYLGEHSAQVLIPPLALAIIGYSGLEVADLAWARVCRRLDGGDKETILAVTSGLVGASLVRTPCDRTGYILSGRFRMGCRVHCPPPLDVLLPPFFSSPLPRGGPRKRPNIPLNPLGLDIPPSRHIA